jgi:hypothetical protein
VKQKKIYFGNSIFSFHLEQEHQLHRTSSQSELLNARNKNGRFSTKSIYRYVAYRIVEQLYNSSVAVQISAHQQNRFVYLFLAEYTFNTYR